MIFAYCSSCYLFTASSEQCNLIICHSLHSLLYLIFSRPLPRMSFFNTPLNIILADLKRLSHDRRLFRIFAHFAFQAMNLPNWKFHKHVHSKDCEGKFPPKVKKFSTKLRFLEGLPFSFPALNRDFFSLLLFSSKPQPILIWSLFL
jgi:hypothetical protein